MILPDCFPIGMTNLCDSPRQFVRREMPSRPAEAIFCCDSGPSSSLPLRRAKGGRTAVLRSHHHHSVILSEAQRSRRTRHAAHSPQPFDPFATATDLGNSCEASHRCSSSHLLVSVRINPPVRHQRSLFFSFRVRRYLFCINNKQPVFIHHLANSSSKALSIYCPACDPRKCALTC